MIPYLLFIAFALFCCCCEISDLNQSAKRVLYVAFFVITVLFVGLRRGDIGFDTITYATSFSQMLNNQPLTDNFEVGYLLFVDVFQSFSHQFNYFLLLVAIISLSIKFYAVTRYSPLVFIPITYYLCYYLTEYEMSAVRQSLAMAFAFVAIYYAKTRRLYIFSAIIFIGSFFHVSLLFFFPFYFLNKIRITYTYFFILLLSSIAFLFINTTALVWKIAGLFPAGSIIQLKLSSYLEGASETGFKLAHIPYILFGGFFFYYSRIIQDAFYRHLFTAFIVGIFFSFLFSGTLGVLNRLTYYYLMLGGILFAYIIYYSEHRINKIVYFLLFSCFVIFKVLESILAPEAMPHYIPYKTFFF